MTAPERRCLLSVLVLAAAVAQAADWPQWRGPMRDGVAPCTECPDTLPAELKPAWSVEVGEGYSGPVVTGGKVVVLSRQGDDEVLQCLDASNGKALWLDTWAAPYKPQSVAKRHGRGPFATPAIDDGRVYSLGIRGALSCHDLANGKRLWRHDFADKFKKSHPTWGAAGSPLVEGRMVIVNVGTRGDGGLAAFDCGSGAQVWQQTADGAAYCSPVAADLGGQRQVVCLMYSHTVGLAAASGKLLWKSPFIVKYEQNIITPVIAGGQVVISGWRQPATAYRIGDGGAQATVAWQNKAESMFMSSPVTDGKHLFGLADRGKGSLVCLDAASGRTLWTSPGGIGEYASIVRAADKLLVLAANGELRLVAASPSEYKELGKVRLTTRPTWAHLAVADGCLFVKDKTHLSCFALPGLKK